MKDESPVFSLTLRANYKKWSNRSPPSEDTAILYFGMNSEGEKKKKKKSSQMNSCIEINRHPIC